MNPELAIKLDVLKEINTIYQRKFIAFCRTLETEFDSPQRKITDYMPLEGLEEPFK
jgi:hypothetical protein